MQCNLTHNDLQEDSAFIFKVAKFGTSGIEGDITKIFNINFTFNLKNIHRN